VAARLSIIREAGDANIHPLDIRQLDDARLLIVWQDGHESTYPYRELRAACRCASCSDEETGEVRVRIEDIPQDIHPLEITPVGRYGISIAWSDGHNTGIYPFSRLRNMCTCPQCSPPQK